MLFAPTGKKQRLAKLLDRLRVLDGVNAWHRLRRGQHFCCLTYHSIGSPDADYAFDADVIDATPEEFREQVKLVAELCRPLTLQDIRAALSGKPLPPNGVLITFDDGYKSCHDTALPTLREFGVSAVFFIATDYVDQRRLFWWDIVNYVLKRTTLARVRLSYPEALELDLESRSVCVAKALALGKTTPGIDVRRFVLHLSERAEVTWSDSIERELADQLIMSWEEVRALHQAGMSVQAHTKTHRVLQSVPSDQLSSELLAPKQRIEQMLDAQVTAIAYPNGNPVLGHAELPRAILAAGYDVGFTNGTGVNRTTQGLEPLDVRRVAMARHEPLSLFKARLTLPVFS